MYCDFCRGPVYFSVVPYLGRDAPTPDIINNPNLWCDQCKNWGNQYLREFYGV